MQSMDYVALCINLNYVASPHMNFRSGITHESPGLVLCLYLITSVALVDI